MMEEQSAAEDFLSIFAGYVLGNTLKWKYKHICLFLTALLLNFRFKNKDLKKKVIFTKLDGTERAI